MYTILGLLAIMSCIYTVHELFIVICFNHKPIKRFTTIKDTTTYGVCSIKVSDQIKLREFYKGLNKQVNHMLGKEQVTKEEWTIVDNGSFQGAIHIKEEN